MLLLKDFNQTSYFGRFLREIGLEECPVQWRGCVNGKLMHWNLLLKKFGRVQREHWRVVLWRESDEGVKADEKIDSLGSVPVT